MSSITFSFQCSEISAFVDGQNTAWFLAQDVLNVLEMSATNATKFLDRHVYRDFKRQFSMGVSGRPAWYVAEPGVYQLAFKSKSIMAVDFQRWVFEEVLPNIRAKGGYISPDATHEQVTALQNELAVLQARLETTQSLMHCQDEYMQGLELSLEKSDKIIADTVSYYKERIAALTSPPLAQLPGTQKIPGWVNFAKKFNADSSSVIKYLEAHKRFTLLDFLKAQNCDDDANTQRCAGHLLRKLGYTPKQVREDGKRVSYWTSYRTA